MINLNKIKPFAEGGNRRCYIHPKNESRCLKITIEGRSKILKQRAPWYKKFRSEKSFDDNFREKVGYSQRALRSNDSYKWKHLAKWYGMVETSLGRASETELIKDDKNNVAITLEKYLLTHGVTGEIKQAISDLEFWLRFTLILTKDLLPHNIVVGHDGCQLVLKIVDGLGSKSFLPLEEISDCSAKIYVERRIRLMHLRINKDLSKKKKKFSY